MPRKPKAMDALELAGRRLAGWSGNGQSWFADCQEVGTRGPDGFTEATHDGSALSIRWRGRVVQAGERGWLERAGLDAAPRKGPTRIRQLHQWGRHGTKVAIPSHRPNHNAAGALSFAKLSGPLAPLLLLYACEDFGQWPKVVPYVRARLPDVEPDAIGDALRRILWGSRNVSYSAPCQDSRAKEIGIRASTYRLQTKRAESLLRDWLDRAAWAFLLALREDDEDGTPGNPDNDLRSRETRSPRAKDCATS